METNEAEFLDRRIEERIRAILLKQGRIKRYFLQRNTKHRDWSAVDFNRVMSELEERGVVQMHPDNTVSLLDMREPQRFPRKAKVVVKPDTIRVHGARGTMLRAAAWDRTGGKCWYCGHQCNPFRDFSVDHAVPVSRGGLDTIENLVPSCVSCNFAKRALSLDEFRTLYPAGHRFWFEREER